MEMDNENVDIMSDSECSDSSESNANSSESSDSSSSDSDESSNAASTTVLEAARILKQHIELPKGLCENANIFSEFFSLDTWNQLPVPIKEHLNTFLPTFSQNPATNRQEQETTVHQLFNNGISRFNNSPLADFQLNLEEGNYRPDISKLRANIQKSQRREQRFQECERISRVAQSLLISREKLLRTAYQAPPGTVLKVDRAFQAAPKLSQTAASLRAKKRYFREISAIADGVGLGGPLSDDENYPEGPPAQLSRKQRRHLSGIQGGATSPGAECRILSTMSPRGATLDHLVGPGGTAALSEEFYRQVIFQHKKRKMEEPDHPELSTTDISLRDVHERTQLSAGHRRPLSQSKLLSAAKKASKTKSETSVLAVSQSMQQQAPTPPPLIQQPPPPPQPVQSQSPLLITPQPQPPQSLSFIPIATETEQFSSIPTSSLKSGTLNQQFQQQLNKSQSLLMLGQNNSFHSISDSDEEIDIKLERESPDIVVSSPLKVETTMAAAAEVRKRPNSVPAAQTVKNTPAKKMIIDNGSMLNLVNSIDAPIVHIKEENITILHDPNHITMEENQTLPPPPTTINLAHYGGTVKAATLSDLEGIDMMHLPIDLDDSGNIDILNEIEEDSPKSLELMQETHSCFLSLIRDIFCSTPNHRTTMENLRNKISLWLSNPITPLNDWYSQADNWSSLVQSAIYFLAGEFLDQPEDFVPYLEYKQNLHIYQWIGAGRDSDQHLSPLCDYWLVRRNEMGATKTPTKQRHESSKIKHSNSGDLDDSGGSLERPASPAPPRFPTTWTVQKATDEEIEEFRAQERRRFDNPHMAFTYRMHGYECVVGPVKGIYTQIPHLTKAREHPILNTDRPNFITILTLVRDATARLPNGEGTRADICELLKSSQYITPTAADNVLQTIVSGALDRMHTEHDPCVRYDPKKKIWIYLHRNRTEEQFEKMHQQFQGISKHKKQASRKVKNRSSKSPVSGGKTIPEDSQGSTPTKAQTPKTSPLPKLPVSPPALVSSAAVAVVATPPAVAPLPTTSTAPSTPTTPQLPALSQIQSPTLLPVSPQSAPPTLNKIPTTPKKLPNVKPELVPISQKIEHIDVEASLDATPILVQKPAPKMPSLIVDQKLQKTLAKSKAKTANAIAVVSTSTAVSAATPVKVSTPTGIQTVLVSTANTTRAGASLLATNPQSVLVPQQNRPQSPQTIAKRIIKPPPLIPQSTPPGHSYIIPISISNSQQITKTVTVTTPPSTISAPKLYKTPMPALTSTSAPRMSLLQQNKLISRQVPAGKSLLSPSVAAANISLQQQQQKLVTTTAQTTTVQIRAQQQPKLSVATAKSQPATSAGVQQRQIIQNIITAQQKPKSASGVSLISSQVVVPAPQTSVLQQQQLHKTVIVSSQQQSPGIVQKILAVPASAMSIAATTTVATVTAARTSPSAATPPGTSLINPQIIQIHQHANQQQQVQQQQQQLGKIQSVSTTNLTPQQQQSILQTLKQQQLRVAAGQVQQQQQQTTTIGASPQQTQQSLIIKQQQVIQQIQKQLQQQQQQQTSPKAGVSLLTTNVNQTGAAVATVSQTSNTPTTPIQSQTLTRIIKPGTSLIQSQVVQGATNAQSIMRTSSTANQPIMAKVLTNSSGQIISLESLLQKQGIAPGTTLRVANAKQGQTSLIQLPSAPGSQITQYAVVSQGRNLISLGTPQRLITTQAQNTAPMGQKIENKQLTAVVQPEIQTIQQSSQQNSPQQQQPQQTIQTQLQPRIIQTSQVQSVSTQPIGKVVGVQNVTTNRLRPSIRMVNASNLNIAHIGGKPVIIAGKPQTNSIQQQQQTSRSNVIWQSNQPGGTTTNYVINTQAVKVQQANNVVGQFEQTSTTPQTQTVLFGNQVVKLHSQVSAQQQSSQQSTNVVSGTIVNASPNSIVTNNARTVVLGATGQPIRVQSPANIQATGSGTVTLAQPQHVVLGQPLKNAVKATSVNTTGQQRVVLAVQGGGQILLPQGFQGGAINLKSLQGLKVIPIQPQTKGTSDDRQLFAQIISSPQAPRPPNPGGEV